MYVYVYVMYVHMYVFETRAHYVAQAGLDPSILMPLLPLCCDGEHVLPHMLMTCFNLEQGQVREQPYPMPRHCCYTR